MGLTRNYIILQAFADAQSAMLADLPSVEDGEFTQTQAGQPASATFESMDADEGMKLPKLVFRVIHHMLGGTCSAFELKRDAKRL